MGGTAELRGVRVTMTPAFHSCERWGVPVGFVLELPGGGVIYHAGDTCLFGDMALIGRQFSPDVALLPAGGFYTMDGVQARPRLCAAWGAERGSHALRTFPVLAPTAESFVGALALEAPGCRPYA